MIYSIILRYKIGKPTGIDIKEQKMTLPLIYTLNNSSPEKKKVANKTQ